MQCRGTKSRSDPAKLGVEWAPVVQVGWRHVRPGSLESGKRDREGDCSLICTYYTKL